MTPPLERVLARLPKAVHPEVSEALRSPSWRSIRRALSALAACPQGPCARIHLLCSFNVEPVLPALQLGLRCIPCAPELRAAPLDTIEQELLDPASAVYQGQSLATVILWRPEELLPDLFFPASAAPASGPGARAREIIARIQQIVQAAAKHGASPVFVSTLPMPPACGSALQSAALPGGLAQTLCEINAAILQLGSAGSRVHALDLNRWAAGFGAGFYDAQMDFMARQPFTTEAALSLGFFLGRNLRPLLVPRRKVLALDLDNTLWGGILGEDGPAGLKVGREFPGSVFSRIQREVLELKHQGVLLVLASKNDPAEARQAMASLPDMTLRWEDFALAKASFNPKYLALREAASELGLGLNSFAFLDDSDFEREQMQAFNPEVEVLNSRGDALHMLACLQAADTFDTHHISDEDRHRHADYALRSARSAPPQDNLETFLASLGLRARIQPLAPETLPRVAQMLGKTNQFNLTTRRHSLDEVQRLAALPGAICLTARLADKFGDQGLVGVLLCEPGPAARSLCVDSFLVSCRALGRGVEDVLWAELLGRASAAGVERIDAQYLPTAKNGLAARLYDRLGLARTAESAAAVDYVLQPVRPAAFPAWITVDRPSL